MSVDTGGGKLGPISLAPGIGKSNAWTLMCDVFFTIGLLTFNGVAYFTC